MKQDEIRDRIWRALVDFAYAIRNESTAESEVSDLADLLAGLLAELWEARQPTPERQEGPAP